jgi:hypothetical protein
MGQVIVGTIILIWFFDNETMSDFRLEREFVQESSSRIDPRVRVLKLFTL